MTAGNNGESTPEDDDPFGYLYEDGQAAAANQRRQGGYGYPGPAAQPGVPRTSYNQVRTVGERQYGQQAPPPQAPYGQQPPYGGQAPYGQQPSTPYAASDSAPGGPDTRQVTAQRGGGRGRGPNTKGLLIGAVAVVAVVVIGITLALSSGDDNKGNDAQPSGAPTLGQSQQPSEPSDDKKPDDKPVELPEQDAATLQLTPPAAVASDVPGAKGVNGSYVSLNGVGASATWTAKVPKGGDYTLFVTYGVPGKDAKTSLFVNDQDRRSINLGNFAQAPEGAWDKGWTVTYAYIDLDKGSNTIKISCEQGDQCAANLDQLELKAGHVQR
jgi:hypothetical protein